MSALNKDRTSIAASRIYKDRCSFIDQEACSHCIEARLLLEIRRCILAVAAEMYELYRASGDAQSGLDVLEAFRVRHPEDAQIMSLLGRALVHAQEFKLDKPLVAEALERLPDDVPLLLAMAEIRSEQRRYIDAGALYERAYELQPTIQTKGLLADAWVNGCRYTEAIALIDEIIADEPESAKRLIGPSTR